MTTKSLGIVILISGRGSNMKAIIDAAASGAIPVEIRSVISNDADATGLETAFRAGLDTRVLGHGGFNDRDSFDSVLFDR